MHILHLITALNSGGAQKIAIGLAEEATLRGHKATLVSISPDNVFDARLARHNICFRSLEYTGNFTFPNILEVIRLRKKLVALIDDIRPDVIHSHLFIPQILLYGKTYVSGIPIVTTEHDNKPWWGKSSLYGKLQTHIDRCFARRTSRYSAVVSKSVQADVMQHLGLPAWRCPLVYNFIDSPDGQIGQVKEKSGQNRLFMVTRLDIEKKGLDISLAILKRVREGGVQAQLVVVGDGPDAELFNSLILEYGLQDCVFCRGYREDIYSQYREADIVLMPSRWEGFGLSAVEAAIMGVPVVASRVGGLQEAVLHKVTGFTCHPEDVSAFAKYTIDLLQDDTLYGNISRAAIKSAKERFSRGQSFEKYQQIYERAIHESQSAIHDSAPLRFIS